MKLFSIRVKELFEQKKDPILHVATTFSLKQEETRAIKQLLTKYQIFTILPQISHFHKYRNFSSIFCNF